MTSSIATSTSHDVPPIPTAPLGSEAFVERWQEAEQIPDDNGAWEQSRTDLTLPSTIALNAGVLFRIPIRLRSVTSADHYIVEKAWQGVVSEISENGFWARLSDLDGSPELNGEFELEEVSLDDRDLVRVGGEFYWNIGYRETRGQRQRYSSLRFRRLPRWGQKQLESDHEISRNLSSLFDEE